MIRKLSPLLAAALVAGAALTAAPLAGAAGTRAAANHAAMHRATRSKGARNGFPSAKQLAGLRNFVSVFKDATLVETQHVHSKSNYKLTMKSTSLVSILYRGKIYSQLGSLKQSRSVTDATPQNTPALYGYATQLDNLFKSPAMKAFKTGGCKVAGRRGQRWDIRTTGATTKYVSGDFRVCTAKRGGYLLSVREVANLKALKSASSSSVVVTSIGKVPAYTPADL